MISVIMPSLNVVNYIEHCIKSVCEQTYDNLEIICVDAGSTDGTLDILNKYACKDSRITIINSDIKSYGYQINLGIEKSHGEYIAIVETDDYIDADMFEQLYNQVNETKADFIKSGYYVFAEQEGSTISEAFPGNCTEEIDGILLNLDAHPQYRLSDINHIWAGLYKRDFLNGNEIHFNESPGASFQDTSFSIIVGLMAKTCIYVRDVYYHYRIDRQESSVKSDEKWDCIIGEFEYIDNYCRDKKIDNQTSKDIWKKKIECYYWNANRLSEESRNRFLNRISDELIKFNADMNFVGDLTTHQVNQLKRMLRIDTDGILYRNENISIQEVEKIIKTDAEYLCVGAGEHMKRLLDIQKATSKKFVKDISDNSKDKQYTKMGDYIINPVEELVQRYTSEKWLIVSAKYSVEIEEQLIGLGIDKNNISIIKKVPRWYEYIGC